MSTKEVPPIVATFAAQVKMTPIAWRYEPNCLEPTCVVIVFEQGPKMRFDLPAPIAVLKPVVFVKASGKKLPGPIRKHK